MNLRLVLGRLGISCGRVLLARINKRSLKQQLGYTVVAFIANKLFVVLDISYFESEGYKSRIIFQKFDFPVR